MFFFVTLIHSWKRLQHNWAAVVEGVLACGTTTIAIIPAESQQLLGASEEPPHRRTTRQLVSKHIVGQSFPWPPEQLCNFVFLRRHASLASTCPTATVPLAVEFSNAKPHRDFERVHPGCLQCACACFRALPDCSPELPQLRSCDPRAAREPWLLFHGSGPSQRFRTNAQRRFQRPHKHAQRSCRGQTPPHRVHEDRFRLRRRGPTFFLALALALPVQIDGRYPRTPPVLHESAGLHPKRNVKRGQAPVVERLADDVDVADRVQKLTQPPHLAFATVVEHVNVIDLNLAQAPALQRCPQKTATAVNQRRHNQGVPLCDLDRAV